MTFDVEFQMTPMTLDVDMGTVYDVTQEKYDAGYAAGYAQAQAEIAPLDALVDGSLTSYANDTVTYLRQYLFYQAANLEWVEMENAEEIGQYACYNCGKLSRASFPKAVTIGQYAFRSCTALKQVIFPRAESIGGYAFRYCPGLTRAELPRATSIDASAFRECAGLTRVELSSVRSMGDYAFTDCKALTTLLLRSETVCTLGNSSVFTNTPIASGTGYIYVPDALVDSYKAATNWSTYAAQIRPISELEG